MRAGDISEGDFLNACPVHVASVLDLGGTVLVDYEGGVRRMDQFDSDDEVNFIPKACPKCGHLIVERAAVSE